MERFKTFWGLSIFILAGMMILLMAVAFMGFLKVAMVFFLLDVFFNYYTFVLTFLFLPSYHSEIVEDYDLTGDISMNVDDI
jgi:hypothetical protein